MCASSVGPSQYHLAERAGHPGGSRREEFCTKVIRPKPVHITKMSVGSETLFDTAKGGDMTKNATASKPAREDPGDPGESSKHWWEGPVKILTATAVCLTGAAALVNAVGGLGIF